MPPQAAKPAVVLYSRPGCHLCDVAETQLRALQPRFGFALAVVDIEENDELHRRFMLEIPVVEVEGEVVARAPITARALEDALTDALVQ